MAEWMQLQDSIQYSLISGSANLVRAVLEIEAIPVPHRVRSYLSNVADVVANIAGLIFIGVLTSGNPLTVYKIFNCSIKVIFLRIVENAIDVQGLDKGIKDLSSLNALSFLRFLSSVYFMICRVGFHMIHLVNCLTVVMRFFNSKNPSNLLRIATSVQIGYEIVRSFQMTCFQMKSIESRHQGNLFKANPFGIEEMDRKEEYYEGREEELNKLLTVISMDNKSNNALLIGESGCGKTAMIKHLVTLIKKNEVPESLKGSRVFNIPPSAFTSGCKYVGMVEGQVHQIFNHLNKVRHSLHQGKVIVFIDEMWQLIGAGQAENKTTDVAGHLLTLMDDPKLVFIGATTPYEFSYMSRVSAFLNRLAQIHFKDLTLKQKLKIVQHSIAQHRRENDESISESILKQAIEENALGRSCRDMTRSIELVLTFMRSSQGNETLKKRFLNACRTVSEMFEPPRLVVAQSFENHFD